MTDRKQDIVERIRERIAYDQRHYPPADPLLREAAAEIERMRGALSHALDNASDMKAALCRDLDPDYDS